MINHIMIHGYLGRDPELTIQDGQNGPYKKVTFSVGVSRNYGSETDWFRCVLYDKENGRRAGVVEKFFSKGSQIVVTGRMESYKPKNDQNRTSWILKVDDFDFCDKANKSNNEPDGFGPVDEEDIPF